MLYLTVWVFLGFCFYSSFWFFETDFFCVTLVILNLALYTNLTLVSQVMCTITARLLCFSWLACYDLGVLISIVQALCRAFPCCNLFGVFLIIPAEISTYMSTSKAGKHYFHSAGSTVHFLAMIIWLGAFPMILCPDISLHFSPTSTFKVFGRKSLYA